MLGYLFGSAAPPDPAPPPAPPPLANQDPKCTKWIASNAGIGFHYSFKTKPQTKSKTVTRLAKVHPDLGDGWTVQHLKKNAEHAKLAKKDLLYNGKPDHAFSATTVVALERGQIELEKRLASLKKDEEKLNTDWKQQQAKYKRDLEKLQNEQTAVEAKINGRSNSKRARQEGHAAGGGA